MTDATPSAPLLRIEKLGVTFPLRSGDVEAVRDASLEIRQGEIVAVVGESGSGKTMIARSILRLLPPPAIISAGRILFDGDDMAGMPEREIRRIRGAGIGMIFQEPLVSLNPALRIGPQMFEAMQLHTGESRARVRARAIELLKAVRIPDPEGCLRRFPHEFSGGMRQRIMIASVMMLKPRLLLADEPTTALDAIVQKDVLDTMQGLVRDLGTAVMLVSHDLGLVSRYADRIVVMEKGVIVEQGDTATVLSRPEHPYTRKLLSSLPSPGIDGPEPDDGGAAAPEDPLLKVSDLRVDYAIPRFLPFQPPKLNHAVSGVSFDLRKGEMLGLVGESGSGKSTLGRAILRLVDTSGGEVRFDGQDSLALKGEALRRLRTKMQMIFQDPYSSLDPRSKVRAAVAEGLRHVPGLSRSERDERTMEILEAVGLGTAFAGRFPHELSGGQRQRVAIARALVSRPLLVVADEPVSALDVTIQAQILDLLRDLKDRLGFSCLFISHDLGVVEAICDRVIVLYKGRIMEEARADRLFARPAHPYTCALMNAVPVLARTEQGYRVRDVDCKPPELPGELGQFFDSERHGSDHRLRDISDRHRVAFGTPPGSPRS